MNEIATIQNFAVGAITLAASRDGAVRAEILKVGDTVRVMNRGNDYTPPKVHTGVIVGFEPFKDLPTIIVAYIEVDYNKAEMKMLYFNEKSSNFEVLAAAPGSNIEIDRTRVLDWFDSEEKKALAAVDEMRAKRRYFEKYFGSVMAEVGEAA